MIDEVLVITMRGPRSYTREDVVEVHAHGGPTCAPRVLEALLLAGGADGLGGDGGGGGGDGGGTVRLARPGEFTLRAFLSGRLSLDQAEAVADVVAARSPAAADAALAGLGLSTPTSDPSSSSSSSLSLLRRRRSLPRPSAPVSPSWPASRRRSTTETTTTACLKSTALPSPRSRPSQRRSTPRWRRARSAPRCAAASPSLSWARPTWESQACSTLSAGASARS